MARKRESSKSRRQMIREQRQQRQQRQRLLTIVLVVGGALLIAGLLIAPSLQRALAPVGEITVVPAEERPMADGRTLGDPNAPVLIEVWEDFQCPSCQLYSDDVEPLVVENFVAEGQVHYVFRHFPFLDDNAPTNESDQAANASMCAAEQGAFWHYHDMLFANWDGENQGAFSNKRLVAMAEAIGLDMTQFNECFEANRYRDEINQDYSDGLAAGVTGTPSVFVNGQILRPGFVPSYQDVEIAVNNLLVE